MQAKVIKDQESPLQKIEIRKRVARHSNVRFQIGQRMWLRLSLSSIFLKAQYLLKVLWKPQTLKNRTSKFRAELSISGLGIMRIHMKSVQGGHVTKLVGGRPYNK